MKILHAFAAKMGFLAFPWLSLEDVPPVERKKSWSPGDLWPAGLESFAQKSVGECAQQVAKQPEISEQDQGHQGHHWLVVWIITTSLRPHWNNGYSIGNHPQMALVQVSEIL